MLFNLFFKYISTIKQPQVIFVETFATFKRKFKLSCVFFCIFSCFYNGKYFVFTQLTSYIYYSNSFVVVLFTGFFLSDIDISVSNLLLESVLKYMPWDKKLINNQ